MKQVYRIYKIIPYDEIEEIFKSGGEAFVEGINRKTAWSASRILTKRLGKEIRAEKRFTLLKGKEVYGYVFVER